MTWELIVTTNEHPSYLRGRCGIITTTVERIDKDTFNVTVPDGELDDVVSDYCEANDIPCRVV